jgi:hypothetical protein
MVLRWKADAGKVKPIIDVHGVDATLKLQGAFFASEDGWWVVKGDYGIGAFVSAVNILVGSNGHRASGARQLQRVHDQAAEAAAMIRGRA